MSTGEQATLVLYRSARQLSQDTVAPTHCEDTVLPGLGGHTRPRTLSKDPTSKSQNRIPRTGSQNSQGQDPKTESLNGIQQLGSWSAVTRRKGRKR